MISQLAQVFSSQGVLIQGTRYASAPPKKKAASATPDSQDPGESFAAEFDQASAKLQLSKGAQDKMAADGNPQATLRKAQTAQMAIQARKEIAAKQSDGKDGKEAGGVAGKAAAPTRDSKPTDPAKAEAAQAETLVAAAAESESAGTDGAAQSAGPAVSRAGGAYARSFTATGRAYSAYA